MKTREEYLQEIVDTIEAAVDDFNSAIPDIEKSVMDDVQLLIKGLDLKNGSISNSVDNLRIIGNIKKRLEKIILNNGYLDKVQTLIDNYSTIAALNNDYFKTMTSEFKPTQLLAEIQNQSVDAVLDMLTESGLTVNVINKVQDILRQNITTGASYNSLVTQMGDFLLTSQGSDGALYKYTQQITTDALNQFSRQYHSSIANQLGYKWYIYTGSNKRTTREFCKYLTAQLYVHESQLPDIVSGDIDGHQCKISEATGLPYGMIEGTNSSNVLVYAGGYNCGHQFYAVDEMMVPESVKASV